MICQTYVSKRFSIMVDYKRKFQYILPRFKCYSDQIFTPWVFKLYLIEFHESLKMPYVYVCVYKKVYT